MVPIELWIGARPAPTLVERVPSERARLRDSGLSRQASRNTRLTRFSASICASTVATSTVSRREVAGAFELGIDRHEVVLAVNLQAVAGIEEQREVGAVELAAELADRVVHGAPIEIAAFHHIEAKPAQRRRHVARVIGRIGQAAGDAVVAVADDERDLAGECARAGDRRCRKCRDSRRRSWCRGGRRRDLRGGLIEHLVIRVDDLLPAIAEVTVRPITLPECKPCDRKLRPSGLRAVLGAADDQRPATFAPAGDRGRAFSGPAPIVRARARDRHLIGRERVFAPAIADIALAADHLARVDALLEARAADEEDRARIDVVGLDPDGDERIARRQRRAGPHPLHIGLRRGCGQDCTDDNKSAKHDAPPICG